MKKKVFYFFLILLSASFFTSCEDTFDNGGDIRLGEIRAQVNDFEFIFENPGVVGPELANNYSETIRFTSIYREAATPPFGTWQVRLSGVNLDEMTLPLTVTNEVQMSFYPEANLEFEGRDGEIEMTITEFENNIIRATFKGTVRRTDFPQDSYRIRNGELLIELNRL